MYALLNLWGNIPSFIHVSDSKMHNIQVLELMCPDPAAIYDVDRIFLGN